MVSLDAKEAGGIDGDALSNVPIPNIIVAQGDSKGEIYHVCHAVESSSVVMIVDTIHNEGQHVTTNVVVDRIHNGPTDLEKVHSN